MTARRIPFAGSEHQTREIHATHVHHSEALSYYGDGAVVLIVDKKPRKGGPHCEVVGERGLDAFGEPFEYADYFLTEELSA